jgi:hypothetical protein
MESHLSLLASYTITVVRLIPPLRKGKNDAEAEIYQKFKKMNHLL